MKATSTYEIEQYELHTMKYRVEANSEAEAIAKLFDGEGEAVCNSLEYIEVAEDFGLPVDEHPDLADALQKLGVSVGDAVIPSIRSIQKV
jgi:type III secretion system FlhB-like substrate exporter